MDEAIKVRVEDLRRALNLVLDEVELRMGSVVDLDADYYWAPDPRAVYDVSGEARAPTMLGQLSDDVQSIVELVTGDRERFVAIWHDLAHINGVLARLAALDLTRRLSPAASSQTQPWGEIASSLTMLRRRDCR